MSDECLYACMKCVIAFKIYAKLWQKWYFDTRMLIIKRLNKINFKFYVKWEGMAPIKAKIAIVPIFMCHYDRDVRSFGADP